MTISREQLAAYADGELDTESARTVESALSDDPELQAQLAAHRALRNRLAAHFAPIAEQPIPERLRQAVLKDAGSAEVIDFVQARKHRAPVSSMRWTRVIGPALAASLVLTFLGINWWTSRDYAQGDLAAALDSQLVATQKPEAPVRMLLSFRDTTGEYCRGFATKAQSGVACREDRGWRLRKLRGSAGGASAEYRQAGSGEADLMAIVQEMAAGPALDAHEEAAAAHNGWRVSPKPR